jgi:predicted MFS family arabinose efflux permease
MNVSSITQPGARQTFSWFVFGLMASVTFVGILFELVPSGVLPQMTESLGVSEGQIGLLVGIYALASAVCAIPLVSATLAVNRKKLLMALLIDSRRQTSSSLSPRFIPLLWPAELSAASPRA